MSDHAVSPTGSCWARANTFPTRSLEGSFLKGRVVGFLTLQPNVTGLITLQFLLFYLSRMLDFYQEHLKFKNTGPEDEEMEEE